MTKSIISTGIIVAAAIGLLTAPAVLAKLHLQWHRHTMVNQQMSYQLYAFGIALLVVGLTILLNRNAINFLKWGHTHTSASAINWLGINGKTSWRRTGLEMGTVISVATFVFMFFAVKNKGFSLQAVLDNWYWILLFSAFNALTEELIFRFGVVACLSGYAAKSTILWVSALIFGLAHYNGYPNGVIGVAMASFLGWLLARATIETQGLGIAWSIHFVQDVIIIGALFSLA